MGAPEGREGTVNEKVFAAIARGLREFGYPDVTAAMIAEVEAAWRKGEPLPHGVIGMFAERDFNECEEKGLLPRRASR